MIGGILIRVISVLVSAVFVVGSWATTGSADISILRNLSIAVLVVTIALAVWNKWVWRTRLAQMLPGVTRDVSGTWEAQLESLWIDPVNKKAPPIKTVYVVIRQTSTHASITLISDESKSKSSMARVVQEDGTWLLHYMYTNEPDVALPKRSPSHHGSGVLTVIGNPAKRVSGTYWTDRDSKGKLTLDRRTRKLGEDFRDCTELIAGREA
ncbi:hypothetical protein [Sneathiella sp.]|uniref:Cap15 family cyclic dinucleotide receptor domain-containing protein n=1 Tax=Sneathiella sp. TaxID=1964365 RepID=UPI0035636259